MRHTTLVLIAILAVALQMPTIWAMSPDLVSTPKNLSVESSKSKYLSDPWLSNQLAVVTTPSMAAFLGETWMPNSTFNGTIYSDPYSSMYPSSGVYRNIYAPQDIGTILSVLTPQYDTALQNATKPNAAVPTLVYAGNLAIPNPQDYSGKFIPHVMT